MKRILLLLVTLFFSAIALAAVNINTASKEELDALPGIGPVKAQAIIDYRKENGPFKTPEDIMKVKGIKEGEFGKIKNDITVSGASTGVPAAKADQTKGTTTRTNANSGGAMSASPAKGESMKTDSKSDKAASSKSEATETATKSEGKREKSSRSRKSEKSDSADKAEKADKADNADKAEKSSRKSKSAKEKTSEKSEAADKSAKEEKAKR